MPLGDTFLYREIDVETKAALLQYGAAFEAVLDAVSGLGSAPSLKAHTGCTRCRLRLQRRRDRKESLDGLNSGACYFCDRLPVLS